MDKTTYEVLTTNAAPTLHPAIVGNAGALVADAVLTLGRGLTTNEHRLLVGEYLDQVANAGGSHDHCRCKTTANGDRGATHARVHQQGTTQPLALVWGSVSSGMGDLPIAPTEGVTMTTNGAVAPRLSSLTRYSSQDVRRLANLRRTLARNSCEDPGWCTVEGRRVYLKDGQLHPGGPDSPAVKPEDFLHSSKQKGEVKREEGSFTGRHGAIQEEHKGEKSGGILGALKGASAKVSAIKGQLYEGLKKAIGPRYDALPGPVKAGLGALAKAGQWVEHKAEAFYAAGKAMGKAVARETAPKSYTDDEKDAHGERVGKLLGIGDAAARWTTNIPVVHTAIEALAHIGGPVAFLGAKAGYYVPVASLAYVGAKMVSTAVRGGNPFKMISNARVRAREFLKADAGHGHGPTTHADEASGKKAFAVRLSKWLLIVPEANKDWAEALYCAVLDEQGATKDKDAALSAAIALYKKNPKPQG